MIAINSAVGGPTVDLSGAAMIASRLLTQTPENKTGRLTAA
jgi:hypothetical protein